MKIREQIENKVKSLGYEIGCYSKELDTVLTAKALKRVLTALEEEYTDIYLTIRRKLYVVSISTVDNDKDIKLYDGVSYFNQFGLDNLEDAFEYGQITEAQYKSIKKQLW